MGLIKLLIENFNIDKYNSEFAIFGEILNTNNYKWGQNQTNLLVRQVVTSLIYEMEKKIDFNEDEKNFLSIQLYEHLETSIILNQTEYDYDENDEEYLEDLISTYMEYLDDKKYDVNIDKLSEINKSDTWMLYRLIYLNDIKAINVENIGQHWVTDHNIFNDGYWQRSTEIDIKDDNLYILYGEIFTKYILFHETIMYRLDFPYEKEITLSKNINLNSFKSFYFGKYSSFTENIKDIKKIK
jgi:hypothetical protein